MSGIASKPSIWHKVYFGLLFIFSLTLASLALLVPFLQDTTTPVPQEGQVALRDYRSNVTTTFESAILTEQRREAAERSISPIYTSPDTRVARQQLDRLRATLAFITSVRSDTYASTEQKIADLSALEDIQLSQSSMQTILELADARWQVIEQEALTVLEKVMSSPIRQEGMEEVINRLPALVTLSLPENQAAMVAELVSAFVAPNSQYSESLTQAARQQARQKVTPVSRSFVAGQTVVQRGQVLSAADIEALRQLGLIQPETKWQDLASPVMLVLLLGSFMLTYLRRKRASFAREVRSLSLISALFLLFLFGARLSIPFHTVIPYVFPLPAYCMSVAALVSVEMALISALPLAILVAYGLPNALELTIFYLVTCLFSVLALGRARRVVSFLWAGMGITISGALVILAYRLPLSTTDTIGLATLMGAVLINGLASASIGLLLQFLLSQFLGMTTPMQLMELTRPDHPLLKKLLQNAPGTYQHSLQVANLAEQAAESIGADPLLTRVGALYHDIGKTYNPVYFIENQVPGMLNPHQGMPPAESAKLIIRHITFGVELGRKYRLPNRVLDFITEHHGTMITRYQYYEAVKAAGGDESQVDIEQFRYPGPKPRSRETAILMLADGSEARVRADRPANEEELRRIIKEAITDRVAKGQLDDTPLTLKDLNLLLETFTASLRSMYHPRLQYPKFESGDLQQVDELPVEQLSDAPENVVPEPTP